MVPFGLWFEKVGANVTVDHNISLGSSWADIVKGRY